MGVETVSFSYEGDGVFNNTQYVIKARQKDLFSKVEVVVEDFNDTRQRFGREFDNIFEFFEWLKNR
ncbi:MAG TPA: hypothetical protein VEG39_19135 [Clostridia bacterium]|nr:hypothetical protein [Clostridia bacterium]